MEERKKPTVNPWGKDRKRIQGRQQQPKYKTVQ